MKNKKKYIFIAIAVIVLAALGHFFLTGKKAAESRVNIETAEVGLTNISTSVTATGTLEAVTTVEVGTQVSGIVDQLYVDYNSEVKKGQVIAVLDRTNLESDLASQQANLRAAESDLQYQQKNYARYSELHSKELVSTSEYDVALQSLRKAQEQVKVAQQSVAKARTNLGYATIYSPIDGIVISKEVEVGQTVASSFNTPTLFTIAKDLRDMQVIANVDEADIGNVAEGQRVTFTVDAFPDDTFSGEVKQVRQNATTTNNVVTYEVVISAPNALLKLKPGLTASVTIYTLERNSVLTVPAKALRYTPDTSVLGKKYKVKDTTGDHKVWTLEGNTLVAHAVKIGTSDGTHTEIIEGIAEGTKVVVDASKPIAGAPAAAPADNAKEGDQESSPFMPGRPGGNKKK